MKSRRGRSFLTTNILAYAFRSQGAEQTLGRTVLITIAVSTRDAVISFQVVQEFLNVATREFPRPMTRARRPALPPAIEPYCFPYS